MRKARAVDVAGGLLDVLEDAVERAGRAVRGVAAGGTVGTTLTALLWTGSQLALVHIGDSRAYPLRDGELFQVTHDHTMVQSMIDDGRRRPRQREPRGRRRTGPTVTGTH